MELELKLSTEVCLKAKRKDWLQSWSIITKRLFPNVLVGPVGYVHGR